MTDVSMYLSTSVWGSVAIEVKRGTPLPKSHGGSVRGCKLSHLERSALIIRYFPGASYEFYGFDIRAVDLG